MPIDIFEGVGFMNKMFSITLDMMNILPKSVYDLELTSVVARN